MPEEQKKDFSEKDLEELFEKAGRMGAILALLHFDSYGRDKENVRASLVDLVSRINAEKGVIYCKGEIEEVLETEDEHGRGFSTYTEVKVLFSNFDIAVGTCLKYGPLTIEILEPNELKMNREQMQNTLLNASSISQQFTNYFMTKLLKKEDLEEFQSNLKKRVERGKELMGGANKPMQAEPKKEKTEE
ncbi:MAG TPA: hypothetical protein VJI13_00685 [Candidatus Norongarragalinales archaeon]|nr:hypothetical protein [Candidatus Norongarragalinales archaeon]